LVARTGIPDAEVERLTAVLHEEYDLVLTRNLAAVEPPHPSPPSVVIACFDPGGRRVATLLRVLRERGWTPPILAVTAEPRADLLLTWLEEGVCGYMTIPFDEQKVRGAVGAVVRRPGEIVSEKGIIARQPLQGWVELTAPSHSEYIERFQHFFDAIHERTIPEDVRRQVLMAVYELGHNAIEWGNRKDVKRSVRITYCFFEDKLVFKIEDEGQGFDVRKELEGPANPLEIARKRREMGKRPGGLGLVMVRRLMDHVFYNEKGNVVVFEKRLPSTS
jgi:anti-sigma regulatory factor (Ser/Thr protein kinase)